jgi:hypothetical protein
MSNDDLRILKIRKILSNLYNDLEKFKANNFSDEFNTKFKHTKYIKRPILVGHNIIHTLPVTCDVISIIHNHSDKTINFKILFEKTLLCIFSIKPNESVYPLYNNSIFPFFLLNYNQYLSISMENNVDLKDLTIICTTFSNIQRKLFQTNDYYYLEYYNSNFEQNQEFIDLITNNNLSQNIISQNIISQNILSSWIKISKYKPIIIKI